MSYPQYPSVTISNSALGYCSLNSSKDNSLPEKDFTSLYPYGALNKQFSKMINEKYPGAHIIVKTGIYVLKTNEVVGVGLDKALKAKKTVKNPTESFCIVYDKDKHENSCC